MSIFGREEPPAPQQPSQPAAPRVATPQPKPTVQATTLISAGTKIDGEISGKTEVRIEGTVEGTLAVDNLVSIGANGQVKGEIHAKSVSVAGKVVGNIHGEEKVDIQSSGKLKGDVKAPRVSIADGAYFKGRVEMTGEAPPPQRKRAAAPQQAIPAAKPL